MAHARDEPQLGAGDSAGGGAAAGDVHHPVGEAVDDRGRDLHAAEGLGAVGLGEDRHDLPGGAGQADAAVPGLPRPFPRRLLGGLDERDRIRRRYATLLQIQTGSRTGNPEGDRARGALAPEFDPRTTTRGQRIKTAVKMLKANG